MEQPLKNAVADTFPFEPLYDLINKHFPAPDTNEAIECFVLQLGCTNAFGKIEQEYEFHAQANAKNNISFTESIKDFYNSIFSQEQKAINEMVKMQPDKLMHLIVAKISYKKPRHELVKIYKIVAAASFYINKSNTATFFNE